MITGTHKSVVIANELDCDNEAGIDRLSVTMDNDWLTKDMAVAVIKHLCKVFRLSEILASVEKYEENQK